MAWVKNCNVNRNASDFFKNSDMALETCLNFKTSETLVETYTNLYEIEGRKQQKDFITVSHLIGIEMYDVQRIENKLVEWMSE